MYMCTFMPFLLLSLNSSSLYTLGFITMTPQLFINYKLKSVAHLPWRMLTLNTFIDDMFAFVLEDNTTSIYVLTTLLSS